MTTDRYNTEYMGTEMPNNRRIDSSGHCQVAFGLTMITFPIEHVNELCRQARKARMVRVDGPDEWSISELDPTGVLRVFQTLRLKRGFVLRAYQYREDGNGDAFVWAMPIDAPFPDPQVHQYPPKPNEALTDLMEAIEGDGTPRSYMEASFFARETDEFGVFWEGRLAEQDVLLGADPFSTGADATDAWKWNERKPVFWEPSFQQIDETATVTFHTCCRLGRGSLFRIVDTFKPGKYAFKTNRKKIAEGPKVYVL